MNILNANVLVLNASYIPLNVTRVRDAIGIVFKDFAKIVVEKDLFDGYGNTIAYKTQLLSYEEWVDISEKIDEEEYKIICSSKHKHFRPFIIKFNDKQYIPKYMITFRRESIWNRDQGICQYTGEHLKKSSFTVDHIIPKSRGGKNTWDNVVLCSKRINNFKGDRTPEEAGLKLLKKPTKPTWFATQFGSLKELPQWKDYINYV